MPRKERHRLHANPFNIRGPLAAPDWTRVFGRKAPFALDVGFGDGRFTVELSRRHPEWNVVGLEIRQHLVDTLIGAARTAGLGNLHAVLANANLQLEELIPDRSVAFVAVNFPDPWFKRRHHKRRVINPTWLHVLSTKLLSGSELHAATDYEPAGREILTLVDQAPGFVNLEGRGQFAPASTTGILTEREVTHLGRGEPIYRVRYRFQPA